KKDTENIDIDVQNVFCFHFWKGKPISRREIEVNVLMLQGLAYVQEIWNKLPDDYTDEKERGVDEYEEQVVKVIKEIGSQEFVNEECKAILKIIGNFNLGNTRQLKSKQLMICESAIKIWERLEKESLLKKETANSLKEQLYQNVFNTVLNSVYKNYKENKLITICNNWLEKIPHENKCHVGILAISVPIYDQLGRDDEVMRKCEVLDDYLRNLTFDQNNINDQFIISVVIEAFYSRWCVCKREAVIESKGWEDVVKAGEAIVKARENFNCSFDFLAEIDEIKKIIRNDSNKDSVIREKVFDYYYKIAIDKLNLENIREEVERNFSVFDGNQNCYGKYVKEICKYSMEFIRTFRKVVDDPKIQKGVAEVARQHEELIYKPSLSLLVLDKDISFRNSCYFPELRRIVDEIKNWYEFPNYQQYIDRLNTKKDISQDQSPV
ncbi:MAG: hypothetical protein J6P19_01305, partial [Acetobacter sp.]|nr:hypothetical protein [Acetobacter sp.]